MYKVEPDIKFKKQLALISGSSLSECIQCGNCSVVCSLAPEQRPFPRKEMIWAAWGLKERLVGNPDIWLCHQCGDCSTHCPRAIRPADVLSSIRKLTFREYAVPKFAGTLVSRPLLLPVAIIIPVVIISSILLMAGTFQIPEGPVDYSRFFPHGWLNGSFGLITLVVYGMSLLSLKRFWRDMKLCIPAGDRQLSLSKSIFRVFIEILLHSRFTGCKTQRSRKLAHLMFSFGMLVLLIVTAYAIVASVTHRYPLDINNPFKIMGNLASLMIYTGLGIIIYERTIRKERVGRSGYEDWLLLISLLLLTLSGTFVETARFLNWGSAYYIYFFHLVSVWFVIIYLPFTKLGHIFYRSLAMIYTRSINRN